MGFAGLEELFIRPILFAEVVLVLRADDVGLGSGDGFVVVMDVDLAAFVHIAFKAVQAF